MSETSDDYSETESDETTEDDYSDEDHVYLISSVANLRRREIMNLKPLRTQSKRTPKVRGRPPNVREGCPTISLEDTKKIIGDNLLRDERKIKYRNPKRHVLSEEKWGEGTTWNDILQEGKERENEATLEKIKSKDKIKVDKDMALQIPGTKPNRS